MIPILRRALLAALLAASCSAPAFSCSLCDNPPAVPPQQLAADEPFDLRSPPGLLPEELESLLGAQSGRYKFKAPYLLDSQAVDPQRHLATTAQVQGLLKARAQDFVSSLRQKAAAGAVTGDDRKAALLLYWYRGPLLAPADQKFLAGLDPTTLGKVPPTAGLGQHPAAGEVLAGAGASAAIPGSAGADVFTAQFLRQVELAGDPEQQAALRQAVGTVLGTPTGRSLAQQFVATGAKARVSFTAYGNTELLNENGKTVLFGTHGETNAFQDQIEVTLNQDFMKTDPAFRQQYMAGTLAHELLGHGLESVKAKKAGVFDTYNAYYRDNESNARLVGWSVEAELGGKVYDSDMWSYLKDPEDFHRLLQVSHPYYSTTFTPEEAKDLLGTLGKRLANAQAALAKIPQSIEDIKQWFPVIDHFVTVHHKARDLFHPAIETLDNFIDKSLPGQAKNLQGIIDHLQATIAHFKSADGAAALKSLQTQFGQDFFAQEDTLNQSRRTHLEGLLQGRSPATFAPPPAGLIGLTELASLQSADAPVCESNPFHAPK
jgi:hypothetical protein